MSDEDVLRERNDVEMMRRPHLWPLRPRLYLKRRSPNRLTPRMREMGLEERHVRMASWRQSPDALGGVMIEGEGPVVHVIRPDRTERIRYESLHELYLDGWVVD